MSTTEPEDPRTAAYFDGSQPSYSTSRLDFVVDRLADAGADLRLIDIGAGDGATLDHILRNSHVTDVTGLDVSAKYVEKIRTELGCEAICGSILDDALVAEHAQTFDVAVLAAVLHHIVGPTRSVSRQFAEQAIRNSLALVKPGGHLYIYEPCYSPRALMAIVFWLKRAVTSVTEGRRELGSTWMNFGEPVVSYYTPAELETMVMRSASTYSLTSGGIKRLGGLITRQRMEVEVTR